LRLSDFKIKGYPMKGITMMVAGLFISTHVFAEISDLEFLAGVEAGIDTATAMSNTDLNHTQHALTSQPIGTTKSWYNSNTKTLYNIKINKYFKQNDQVCVNYDLVINHKASLDVKPLKACLNEQGNWIAQLNDTIAM
jgi:surface antigen